MSLMASRRYLLADGVERWTAKQAEPVIAALGALPPGPDGGAGRARGLAEDQGARRGSPRRWRRAGGEVLRYRRPGRASCRRGWSPRRSQRGFRLEPDAARLLVERMGEGTLRLANELERLALWAGPEGEVDVDDLEAMVADTSEEAVWTLSDAIVARDPAAADRAPPSGWSPRARRVTAARLSGRPRLREAHAARAASWRRGRPQGEVEARLTMHPYAAKMLVRRLAGASPADLRAATCALADLEWWTRGGSDYPDDVALTLAVRRAAGAGAGAG